MSDMNTYDANEFVSAYVKKEELVAGAKRFTIDGVSKTTFEARKGRDAQTVLVLELDGSRKYSLSTKADLHTLIGVFTDDNAESRALHRRLGFVEVGRLREVGHKFGRFIDTSFWQLLLEPSLDPSDE